MLEVQSRLRHFRATRRYSLSATSLSKTLRTLPYISVDGKMNKFKPKLLWTPWKHRIFLSGINAVRQKTSLGDLKLECWLAQVSCMIQNTTDAERLILLLRRTPADMDRTKEVQPKKSTIHLGGEEWDTPEAPTHHLDGQVR